MIQRCLKRPICSTPDIVDFGTAVSKNLLTHRSPFSLIINFFLLPKVVSQPPLINNYVQVNYYADPFCVEPRTLFKEKTKWEDL